jgi:hypothetical protein
MFSESASTAPPLLSLAQKYEEEDENDEPAHLGEGDREAEEPGQNANVDGVVTQDCARTGGDQFVILLNADGAAQCKWRTEWHCWGSLIQCWIKYVVCSRPPPSASISVQIFAISPECLHYDKLAQRVFKQICVQCEESWR